MSYIFYQSCFNGDISKWDVSNVVLINEAFVYSKFRGNISEWRLINVDNIEDMFQHCKVSIPYWAKIKDFEERVNSINSYYEKKILNNKIKDDLIKTNCIINKL